MKKPQTAENLTTCTATRRELKYAYTPIGARVVAASVITDVQISTLSTSTQQSEAQQVSLEQLNRALHILN